MKSRETSAEINKIQGIATDIFMSKFPNFHIFRKFLYNGHWNSLK